MEPITMDTQKKKSKNIKNNLQLCIAEFHAPCYSSINRLIYTWFDLPIDRYDESSIHGIQMSQKLSHFQGR